MLTSSVHEHKFDGLGAIGAKNHLPCKMKKIWALGLAYDRGLADWWAGVGVEPLVLHVVLRWGLRMAGG